MQWQHVAHDVRPRGGAARSLGVAIGADASAIAQFDGHTDARSRVEAYRGSRGNRVRCPRTRDHRLRQ